MNSDDECSAVLHQLNGDISLTDFDEQQITARSGFADMLHDKERNEKYYEAIRIAVDKMHSRGKKANVLDIGTGSGLLSMMAVKCGADSVIACDAVATIIRCAKEVTTINNVTDKIKLVTKHSTALTVGPDGDLPERANILVAEVFDTELIGEGALSTFSHAIEELLDPDCIIVPSSGTVYAQIVECNLAENWNKCKDFLNDDGELFIKGPSSIKKCAGCAAVHDIQLNQISTDSFKQICAPQAVIHFDWSRKLPFSFNEHNVVETVAECDGTAQAIFFWWELAMDPDNKILLSCAPYWAHPSKQLNCKLTSLDIPWRDHWLQAIYYLPTELPVKTGEQFNLVSCHDEFSLWFYLETALNSKEDYKRLVCDCIFHVVHSRMRIGQINDQSRRNKYLSLIKKHVNSDSVVLCLGSSFYAALIAAKIARKLIVLDENGLTARILQEFIETNNLTNVDILENIDDLVLHENTKDITLIMAEPFFDNTILSWENALFAYNIITIKKYVKQEVMIIPKECTIKGILVEFQDLHKIHFPVVKFAEFSLEPFDCMRKHAMDSSDSSIDAQPLWEYPSIAKSHQFVLTKLNMCDINSSPLTSITKLIEIQGEDKSCNAIALWSEWDMDGTDKHMISTGPTVPTTIDETIQWDIHTKQGVHFMVPKCKSDCNVTFKFSIPSCTSSISVS